MVKKYDLKQGDRFGRLVITGEREYRGRNIYEKCICDCGNDVRVPRGNIIGGTAKSCGCFKKENCRKIQAEYGIKHGMARTRIYHIRQGILTRTRCPNHISYSYYGGRGIKCMWNSFNEFYRDMGIDYEKHVKEFGERDTTIDRIDTNGDYCKENCKWSSWKEQMHNRNIVNTYGFNYTKMKNEGKSD